MIVFACCIRDEARFERAARAGLAECMEDDSTFVRLTHPSSIFLAYNGLLDLVAARDDVEALVLLDDDVELRDRAFTSLVRSVVTLPDVAVAGVVGATAAPGTAWWKGTVHGRLQVPDGSVVGTGVDSPAGVADVTIVGGGVLVLAPWTFRNLRFDTVTFDGWYAHDADLCAQAVSCGRRVVVFDTDAVRHSAVTPASTQAWADADARWREKWSDLLDVTGRAGTEAAASVVDASVAVSGTLADLSVLTGPAEAAPSAPPRLVQGWPGGVPSSAPATPAGRPATTDSGSPQPPARPRAPKPPTGTVPPPFGASPVVPGDDAAYGAHLAEFRRQRRSRLSLPLFGVGMDLGPGHLPFRLPPGAHAVLVDRLPSDRHAELFPELPPEAIPAPDVVADLDVDRLRAFPDASVDFAVASHVLEHLANPLALVADVWRVLRPGGLLLILLPDRRRTFDRNRPPTPVDVLLDKWSRDVREVTDDEIVAFARATDGAPDAVVTREQIELHRARSIHVHTWTDHEFVESLAVAFEHGLRPFLLLDGSSSSADPRLEEFGLLLQRPLGEAEDAQPAARLRHHWRESAARQAAALSAPLAAAAADVVTAARHLLPPSAVVAILHHVMARTDLQAAFGPFPERVRARELAGWIDAVLDDPAMDDDAAWIAAMVETTAAV